MAENKIQLFTQENSTYCGCFPTKKYKLVQGEYVKKDEEYNELLELKSKKQELQGKEKEYNKLQEEKQQLEEEEQEFNKLKENFEQEKKNYINKKSEEYQGLLKKQSLNIDGVDVSCGDIINACADDGAKRILVEKIINKTEIYNYYNTKLTDANKMPDDIDMIYNKDKNEWLESKDLTQDKITELNKNIGGNKSNTDLAYCENNQVPILLKGSAYNLKNAAEGKYKKVLVING